MPVEQLLSSRRTRIDGQLHEVTDDWRSPEHAHRRVGEQAWTGSTVFEVAPPPVPTSGPSTPDCEEVPEAEGLALAEWSPKQWRQVRSAAKAAQASVNCREKVPYQIVEVFSPPRFALEGSKTGLSCLSADLITGWDFRKATDRDAVRTIIAKQPPELLVLSPPCT